MNNWKLSQQMYDSLYSLQKSSELSKLQVKYETQLKEQQIESLTKDQQIKKAEIAKRNSIIILILLSTAVLGLIIIVLFYRYRNKQQRTRLYLEKQNMQIQQQLELAQFKEDFFTNISHEFRTPLTLIISPLEEMLANQHEGITPHLKLMHRNAYKLLNYINQILDISKIESGTMTVQSTKLNLEEFMKNVYQSYTPLANKKRISFKLDSQLTTPFIFTDLDKLDKIINNLLSNAFKYTPDERTICVTVNELSNVNSKRSVQFVIEDTGNGITQQHLPYIFDRFYHVTKDIQMASSGIGLALVKELTELLGGTITVDSTVNKGSKFSLTIPESPNNNIHIAPNNETTYTVEEKSNFFAGNKAMYAKEEINPIVFEIDEDKRHNETILIVEDNTEVRDYLNNLLKHNYHLIEAENGQSGLQKAFEYTPDLIITDLMMPVMDGIDFTEQVKSDVRTSHIPVVMLTAKADIKNKLEGIETGADDYLTKPFHPEELLVRCGNLITQRKKLHKLFSNNLLTVDKISINSMDDQFLNKLRNTVHENLSNTAFDVELLSNKLNMSRMNLYRKVKALTGITPVDYIKTMRLQYAKQLLEHQAGNIADIAVMSGFENPSYFSKCYKQKYGVLPSEYAKV